jgi:hypothetical protein
MPTIQSLVDDDRAVTPVIGIVLVVALAVILAAIVSVYAFGLFGVAQDAGPTMDFSFDYNTSAGSGDTDSSTSNTTSFAGAQGLLEITFQGGEKVDSKRLTVLRGSDEFAVSDLVTTERVRWARRSRCGSRTTRPSESSGETRAPTRPPPSPCGTTASEPATRAGEVAP